MNNKKGNSSVGVFIILVIIIVGAIWFLNSKYNNEKIDKNESNNQEEISEPISLCYYLSKKTDIELYDRTWLKINILDDKVNGEFQHLPAETDSKIGAFEGEVGPLDPKIMGRRANVWWNSFAEGMSVKEELVIEFGEGSATVAFGEMVDRGDGVYVYKDKENLFYIEQMNQIDCNFLEEKINVEKYVQDNIKTIATNKPVLGGSWYVFSVEVIPSTNKGFVIYEDGHIQSKANFTYIYKEYTQEIEISKFEIIK